MFDNYPRALAETFGAEYSDLTDTERQALHADLQSLAETEGVFSDRAAVILHDRIRPASLRDYVRALLAGQK